MPDNAIRPGSLQLANATAINQRIAQNLAENAILEHALKVGADTAAADVVVKFDLGWKKDVAQELQNPV